jgi:DNA-binding MarR family transcriptional regulator
MTEREIKSLLNKVLKELFFKILRIQEKIVSKSANGRLSRTEMHMLEEIEETENATLTNIAGKLGITKATASVSAARLESKEYIEKVKSDNDKRISYLTLTEKGRKCCSNHRQFHDRMVQSLLKDFNISEYPDVLKSLSGLSDFFSSVEKNY